jgi:uncharacterized protein with von Willebrand factor type A (vWA) domain
MMYPEIEAGLDLPQGDEDTIVGRIIADGSQVVAHDGYDVQAFAEAVDHFARLGTTVAAARQCLITAPALYRDLFWTFYKRVPALDPVVPLSPAYRLNQQLLEQIVGTAEWRTTREAGTVGDLLTSAMAVLGVAQKALDALDEATIRQVNHLHEMESGTADLFARAEALADLASQAEGDRARQLFAQAQAARARAERTTTEMERIQESLDAEDEARGNAVRRAARGALIQAEQQIDNALAAIKTYGSGYGGGHAGQALTTKDKIDLATKVQQSTRLKQIAAICGRFTRVALEVQRTKVRHPPDEITSITIGADIAHVLPSELGLLSDPQLEDLFFLKFAEGRLMQYDLIGRDREGQGPIIVALDGSGSMGASMGQVTREVWAKGVALALLAIARLQGRDLAVLHFAQPNQLDLMRFPKGQGSHMEVIALADHFFYGGSTVFEPWMQETLRLVDEAKFNWADVIAISDGLTSIDPVMRVQWQQRRDARGMRCYGVLIGDSAGETTLASICDAVLTLDNMAEDTPVLQTIFSV